MIVHMYLVVPILMFMIGLALGAFVYMDRVDHSDLYGFSFVAMILMTIVLIGFLAAGVSQ